MDKPRSRYEVIDKQGRLLVLVDGQLVEGFATRAPDAAGNLTGLNPSHVNAARPNIATPTPSASLSATHTTAVPITVRHTPPSGIASPKAASSLEKIGRLLMVRVAKGRDASGRLIIERTIERHPHRADLSAEEERRLAFHLGIWLMALSLVLIALPSFKLAGAISLVLLFKLGWPFAFWFVPKQRWKRVSQSSDIPGSTNPF